MSGQPPSASPAIALVVAVAENGVIGADGGLPWRLPTDLKHFKAVTMGGPVIMGRKTWDSIGKALPGRHNIVVTRNAHLRFEGADTADSLERAISMAQSGLDNAASETFVIGGGAIFDEVMPLADRLYVTHVRQQVEGDTYFPTIDEAVWEAVEAVIPQRSERDSADMEFVTYERRNR